MAAPSAITFFQSFREYLGDGTFDLNTNTFKAQLHTSTFTPNASTMAVLADVTNEVANGNGYTTGGVTMTGVAWTRSGATVTFDAADVSWTGATAGFAARYLLIYASGTLNGRVNPLVGYMLLDSAPADVSFATGNTVTVQWNAAGIFTLT